MSNLGEVGQIRRRSGISMKMMMKAETLLERSAKHYRDLKKMGMAHRQKALNKIIRLRWNMFAIPNAKQRMMQSTPVLRERLAGVFQR